MSHAKQTTAGPDSTAVSASPVEVPATTPSADRFRTGDVWQSPYGATFRVTQVTGGAQACLRLGERGTGAAVQRRFDDVGDWTRLSSGWDTECAAQAAPMGSLGLRQPALPAQGNPQLYACLCDSNYELWRLLRMRGWRVQPLLLDDDNTRPRDRENVLAQRWRTREGQIASSDGLILHAQPQDFPLQDALVEIGMAIGMGKPVALCIVNLMGLEGLSMELLDSLLHHPRCEIFTSLDAARAWIWRDRLERERHGT